MKLLASLAILKSADANITCYSCVASRGADGSSLGVSDDRLALNRGRHPGQGPRDPAVQVPEIWDRDRDWDSF